MKKANINRWAEKAKQKGFVNVNKISTGGIDNYHIDCGGEAEIYTLSEFEFAFNNEGISDMGYIVFV